MLKKVLSVDEKLDQIMKSVEVLSQLVEDAREDQKLVNEEIIEKLENLNLGDNSGFSIDRE